MNNPQSFRAGDSVSWTESLPEYLASSGWLLKFRMLWPTGAAVSINTTADGNNFLVNLLPADTAGWATGRATLVPWVEKGTERITIAQQSIIILPNLATANTFDNRSKNQIALSDAEAALVAYSAGGKIHVAEYDIAGRRMKFRDSDQIISLINYYKIEVAKEKFDLAALSGKSPGRVVVRF